MNIKKTLINFLNTLDENNIEYNICIPQREKKLLYNQKSLNKINFTHISYDSKNVKADTFFVCKGQGFEETYLVEAIELGSIAYLADRAYQVDVPGIIVKDIRKATFVLAEFFYGYPQNKLKLIGITGTKGKSTTAILLKNILNQYAEKNNLPLTGIISTLGVFDGTEAQESNLTTPEPIELMKILASCHKNGLQYVIIEASSQAFKYDRLTNIQFDTAAFLNVSQDHISPIEHPDFDDYLKSKLKIFDKAKKVVVNQDMPLFSKVKKALRSDESTSFFSRKSKNADYFLANYSYTEDVMTLQIRTPNENIKCQSHLPGLFNAMNILAAVAIADIYGIDKEAIKTGVFMSVIPGRMDILESKDENILTIIDFAHNKLSFEKIFDFVEEHYPNYYKIAIFGSVGGKAKNRRQELGSLAGQHADLCLLTCDNNDQEDLTKINAEIAESLKKHACSWQEIQDRKTAIKESFNIAKQHINERKEKVLLLILGRGPEDTMKINGITIPYLSDKEVAKECIAVYDS